MGADLAYEGRHGNAMRTGSWDSPLSLITDWTGVSLQNYFPYFFLSLLQQTEQLLQSFIMESVYLK